MYPIDDDLKNTLSKETGVDKNHIYNKQLPPDIEEPDNYIIVHNYYYDQECTKSDFFGGGSEIIFGQKEITELEFEIISNDPNVSSNIEKNINKGDFYSLCRGEFVRTSPTRIRYS